MKCHQTVITEYTTTEFAARGDRQQGSRNRIRTELIYNIKTAGYFYVAVNVPFLFFITQARGQEEKRNNKKWSKRGFFLHKSIQMYFFLLSIVYLLFAYFMSRSIELQEQ